MNREKMLNALDDAFKDELSKLFNVLMSGEAIGSTDLSVGRFENGLAIALDAYGRAATVIEKRFPE